MAKRVQKHKYVVSFLVFANIEKDLEVELTICGACEENTEKENIVNRAKELDCVTLDLRYVPDEEIVLIYK